MRCVLYLSALVLVISLGFSQADSSLGSQGGRAVPTKRYTVDLDQPPEKRWLSILKVYKSSVPLIIDFFNNQGSHIQLSILKRLLSNMYSYFGEYGAEMKAIADFLGIDVGTIVTLNLSYELRRLGGGRINTTGNVTHPNHKGGMGIACSSILARNRSGDVFHGRTLDWEIPENLRNLTVQVDFLRGGEVVLTGDVIVGTVSVATGISKKGGFSLSIDERSLGGSIFNNGIHALLNKSKCPGLFAREVLTSSTSYAEAVKRLREEQLIAPVYYIIAGSGHNEGAVITRARNKCLDFWPLDNSSSTGKNDTKWFLVETNYDRWEEPEPYDNRRGYAIQYLTKLGQDRVATAEGMKSVIAMWPIRNNYTSSSALMIPGEFLMQSNVIYP